MIYVYLQKSTHNESGDIILAVISTSTTDYEFSLRTITVKGITNSPIDYEYTSDAFDTSIITDSSKDYSSSNYETIFDYILIRSKIGCAIE